MSNFNELQTRLRRASVPVLAHEGKSESQRWFKATSLLTTPAGEKLISGRAGIGTHTSEIVKRVPLDNVQRWVDGEDILLTQDASDGGPA